MTSERVDSVGVSNIVAVAQTMLPSTVRPSSACANYSALQAATALLAACLHSTVQMSTELFVNGGGPPVQATPPSVCSALHAERQAVRGGGAPGGRGGFVILGEAG